MLESRSNLLRAWWPAVVWMMLIRAESTEYFSGQHTGSMLYALLTRLFGHVDVSEFEVFHHYLRKTGHVVGYGILSLLLLRAFRATFHQMSEWIWRTAVIAWVGTAVVAGFDEWHQSFIPSRTGTPQDVLLDSAAGLFFLLIARVWMRRSNASGQAPDAAG